MKDKNEKPTFDPNAFLLFDPNAFLLKVNRGRTVFHCRENQVVYRQGDTADAVFYIQTGKAKVIVTSEQGKEAVVGYVRFPG